MALQTSQSNPTSSSSSVKFAITAERGQAPPQTKVVYNNTAISTPLPRLATSRGSDPSQVHFTVEVKLLNDDQEALLIDVNVSA